MTLRTVCYQMIRRIIVFVQRDYQNDTKSIEPNERAFGGCCFDLVVAPCFPGNPGLPKVGQRTKYRIGYL